MREKLQTLPLAELKELARSRGIKGISSLRKAEIIELLCAEADKNPDHDYANFIEEYTGKQMPKGNFVDLQGNVLGRHEGISHYTIGQRKGLNLSMGRPVFVVEIRPETNEVVIGEGKDVFTNVLCCSKLNWMAVDGLHGQAMEVIAKIRYSHRGAPCTIREIGPRYLRPRFSPGYGDFPLDCQQRLLDSLEAGKRIGIKLTDSLLMMPSKSVTAVMGVSKKPYRCDVKGCESCGKRDCLYRR